MMKMRPSLVILLGACAAVAAGCSSDGAAGDAALATDGADGPAATDTASMGDAGTDAGTDAADPCPGSQPSTLSSDDIGRESKANSTEIVILFLSLECLAVPERLTFSVGMTNHSCSIPGYNLDLDQSVELRTDEGTTVSTGFSYDVKSADDHHPLGILSIPARPGGKPLVSCDTKSLTLAIVGVDQQQGERRTFTWEGALLDGIRDCR